MELPKRPFLADKLIGLAETFSLEARVFHSVCLLMMAGVALNVLFNLLAGLPEAAWLMLGVFVASSSVYYLSRFLNRTGLAIAIFLSGCNIVLAVNYYYNSGLNGPTYAIFLLCLLLTVAVAPRRQYLLWVPLNVAVMLALFAADYYYPEWVADNYRNRGSKFSDFIFTYLIIGGLIVFVLVNIRKAYHQERRMGQRRTLELAAANDVKNKLLSILAHDLKEPLNSIQGFLELLNDDGLDQAERRLLQTELRHRTQNASDLLANVLSWTRSQMEGLTVRKVPLNVAELLQPVLKLLEPLAEEKAVSLLPLIPTDACALADPDMLQLVIRNLLTNAIKYSHPGGDVRLSVFSNAGICKLTVRDEGEGIPTAQQPHLFSLATSSALGTHREKGAGLGLYLCSEFMDRQGGTISFTTEAGNGTTFTISLPAGNAN